MYQPPYTLFTNSGFRTGQRPLGSDIFVPDLPTPLDQTRAFWVGDRVWVIGTGGRSGYSWAPGEMTWRAETKNPNPEQISVLPNHGMAIDNGTKIYCIGGSLGTYAVSTAIFDTATRTWSKSADYALGRGFEHQVPVLHLSYIAGMLGNNLDGRQAAAFLFADGSYAGAFADAVNPQTYCVTPCFQETLTDIYAVGGTDNSQCYISGAFVEKMRTVGGAGGSYSAGVRLAPADYVITGGLTGANSHNLVQRMLNTVWSTLPAMIGSRMRHGMWTLDDGSWLVAGGISSAGPRVATTEIYNGSSWSDAGNLREARSEFATVTLPAPYNAILVIGGQTGALSTTTVDVFQLGRGWSRTIAM